MSNNKEPSDKAMQAAAKIGGWTRWRNGGNDYRNCLPLARALDAFAEAARKDAREAMRRALGQHRNSAPKNEVVEYSCLARVARRQVTPRERIAAIKARASDHDAVWCLAGDREEDATADIAFILARLKWAEDLLTAGCADASLPDSQQIKWLDARREYFAEDDDETE